MEEDCPNDEWLQRWWGVADQRPSMMAEDA
jgi:hypothetical protein